MRIVVLVKEVPDTYGDRVIDVATGLTDRSATSRVIDEIGERAVEAALRLRDTSPESTVVVVTMAPDGAQDALRKTLAMGADEAVLIADDSLRGADLALTARVLAEAVRRQTPDLVITGNISTDGNGGVISAMLAEILGWAQATNLRSVELSNGTVRGERTSDVGVAMIEADLPAVVSVTEAAPEARFPNFKGIMAAKKKPLTSLAITDLGIVVNEFSIPHSIVLSAAERPPRAAGVKIVDEGDGGRRVAEYLIEQKLA